MKNNHSKAIYFLATILFLVPAVLGESVLLEIAPGFPQDGLYGFTCNPDFNATAFSWEFGDGNSLSNITNSTVFHTFTEDGNYTVTCTGMNETVNASDERTFAVDVDEQEDEDLTLLILSPLAQQYESPVPFRFETNLPSTMTYMVNGTNATACTNCTEHEENRTLLAGEHVLVVFATEDNSTVNASIGFSVLADDSNETDGTNDTDDEPPVNGSASIAVKDFYPQTGAYVFECNTPGFTPASFSWFYGDGMKGLEIPNQNVFHTYLANGGYNVICRAHDAAGNVVRDASLDVSINDIPRRNTCSVMQNSPAICEGGEIVDQGFGSSCRKVVCQNDEDEREVLVCDKPSADNPLYFEMYEIRSDNDAMRICIAGTCIGPEEGFARSGFLFCNPGEPFPDGNGTDDGRNTTGGTTRVTLCHNPLGNNPRTITVDDNAVPAHLAHGDRRGACPVDLDNATNGTNGTVNASVSLAIAEGFPQGNNVVLLCTPENFEPTRFDWTFGDNHTQTTGVGNVFHVYPGEGEYDAACVAAGEGIAGDDAIVVNISVSGSGPVDMDVDGGNMTDNSTMDMDGDMDLDDGRNETNMTDEDMDGVGNETANMTDADGR